jgi:hypothetical protein
MHNLFRSLMTHAPAPPWPGTVLCGSCSILREHGYTRASVDSCDTVRMPPRDADRPTGTGSVNASEACPGPARSVAYGTARRQDPALPGAHPDGSSCTPWATLQTGVPCGTKGTTPRHADPRARTLLKSDRILWATSLQPMNPPYGIARRLS